ncbi:MAG: Lrp/AsnC family transcriptional regulator [Firmicutes bacterium]|nr:Lrp/AsnC family transcriptional regulator [Bacillota bacterium]
MYVEGKMDEKDFEILKVILRNARLSYSQIGEKVHLSRVSVKNRMDAMEKRGIILGYETKINREGRKFFIDIYTEPECFDKIIRKISSFDVIKKVYAMTGDSKIHIEGDASDNKSYEMFMKEMKSDQKGIRAFIVQDVLYTYKNEN